MNPLSNTTMWRASAIGLAAILLTFQYWTSSGAQAAAGATVKIVGSGASKSLTPGFLGSNIENAFNKSRNPNWNDPTLASYLAKFAGILRSPAGTAGNYWDWSIGWSYPNFTWPSSDYLLGPQGSAVDTAANLSSLITLIEQSGGAAPDVAYVLNILSTNDDASGGRLAKPDGSDDQNMVADQLQMLAASANAQLPVHYIELGNEFYLHGVGSGTHAMDNCQVYPSTTAPPGTCSASGTAMGDANDDAGAGYATRVDAMIPSIKAQYPNSKVAAVGENPLGWGTGTPYRALNWDSKMLPLLHGADAVVFHDYPTLSWNKAAPQAVMGVVFYDWSNGGMQAAIDAVENYGINEAWITEFDFSDNTSPTNPSASVFAPAWVHGLANSQMLIQYLSDAVVSRAAIYSATVDSTIASGIYYPGTSLSLPLDSHGSCSSYQAPNQFQCTVTGSPASGCSCTIPTVGGEAVLTGTGQAMGLFGRGLSGATSEKPLSFSGSPVTTVTVNGTSVTYSDVTGVQIFNASGFQLIVSNYSQSSLTLDISWTGKKKAQIESLFAPSLMTYVTSNTTLTDAKSSTSNGIVTLPANSISRIF